MIDIIDRIQRIFLANLIHPVSHVYCYSGESIHEVHEATRREDERGPREAGGVNNIV